MFRHILSINKNILRIKNLLYCPGGRIENIEHRVFAVKNARVAGGGPPAAFAVEQGIGDEVAGEEEVEFVAAKIFERTEMEQASVFPVRAGERAFVGLPEVRT